MEKQTEIPHNTCKCQRQLSGAWEYAKEGGRGGGGWGYFEVDFTEQEADNVYVVFVAFMRLRSFVLSVDPGAALLLRRH